MSSSADSRLPVALNILAILLGLAPWPRSAIAQSAPSAASHPLHPGAPCGFIAPCTRIGEIALHLNTLSSLRTDPEPSFIPVQGDGRCLFLFLAGSLPLPGDAREKPSGFPLALSHP